MSNGNISNEIYSGAANFGVVMATILAIFGTFFGIIFIVSGFKLRNEYSNRSNKTKGIVINNPDCKPHLVNLQDEQRIMENTGMIINEEKDLKFWNCTNVQVLYNINGEVVRKVLSTDDTRSLKKDDNVAVYFDPKNIRNVSLEPDNRGTLGLASILVGIAVLLLAFLRLYLTRRYKFIAAVGGASTAANLLF